MKPFWIGLVFLLCIAQAMPEQEAKASRNFFYSLARLKRSLELNLSTSSASISSSIKIIGGSPATPHQFPYLVAIHVRNYDGGYSHYCGGSIYDASHIITAAHCVWGIHPRNLKVVAGEHELFQVEGPEQYRDVEKYVFRPDYDSRTYDNDVAIITLEWPLDLNDKIQPLKVPLKALPNPPTARTSGWGENELGEQTKLLYVDLDIFTPAKCASAYERVKEITQGMLCAGDEEGGRGSCMGDSGGPLICKDGEGEEYLCGLVSWGMVPCGSSQYPTVFADINNYVKWLDDLLPDRIE